MYFGKEHHNVLKAIRAIEMPLDLTPSFFIPTTLLDHYGRDIDGFDMTRDGFTLLAMGFTGKKALQFKLKYTAQFNAMEEQLKNPVQPVAIPTNYAEALRMAADGTINVVQRLRGNLPQAHVPVPRRWHPLERFQSCR